MSNKLPEAIAALTRVAEAQLEAVREEMRRQERREVRERLNSPEHRAEMLAMRRPPHRFSPQALLRAAPWIYVQAFEKEVPAEFYAQVEDGAYVVACPCGTDHTVGAAGYPMGAPCGRYFLYDGQAMRVWSGPSDEAEAAPAADDQPPTVDSAPAPESDEGDRPAS